MFTKQITNLNPSSYNPLDSDCEPDLDMRISKTKSSPALQEMGSGRTPWCREHTGCSNSTMADHHFLARFRVVKV